MLPVNKAPGNMFYAILFSQITSMILMSTSCAFITISYFVPEFFITLKFVLKYIYIIKLKEELKLLYRNKLKIQDFFIDMFPPFYPEKITNMKKETFRFLGKADIFIPFRNTRYSLQYFLTSLKAMQKPWRPLISSSSIYRGISKKKSLSLFILVNIYEYLRTR